MFENTWTHQLRLSLDFVQILPRNNPDCIMWHFTCFPYGFPLSEPVERRSEFPSFPEGEKSLKNRLALKMVARISRFIHFSSSPIVDILVRHSHNN